MENKDRRNQIRKLSLKMAFFVIIIFAANLILAIISQNRRDVG